jgi:hypothetical protein
VLLPTKGEDSEPPRAKSAMAIVPMLTWMLPEGTRAVSTAVGGPAGDQFEPSVQSVEIVDVQVNVVPAMTPSPMGNVPAAVYGIFRSPDNDKYAQPQV